MIEAGDTNLGDVVLLESKTGHIQKQGVVVNVIDEITCGQITQRYSIRLPDDSLIEANKEDLRRTGKNILIFQMNEVVRVLHSDKFPEVINAEGSVCAFGEIAPREFEYAVYIPHLERVYAFLAEEIESLGRFESFI